MSISNPAPSAGTTIELGELNLTPNSLLHTDSGGVAEAIADVAVNQVLTAQGVSAKPAYSASPTLTGLTLSGLTQGSVPFAGASGLISQNNSELFWDDTNKRLGIGTVSPNAKLDVGGIPGASVGGFPSGNLHVTGQSASVNANSVITGHNLFGGNKQLWYFGSLSGSNDAIGFINRQNASLSLSTNSATRLTIEPGGSVGIGTTAASAQLHVDQPSTTGAQPVLLLDQADISEEMIEFATTIGVGNAIEAVGAKALTITHFIKVTIPGGLTRYFGIGTIA